MRLSWRPTTGIKTIRLSIIALALNLSLSACSTPDIHIDRKPKRAEASGNSFFTKVDEKARAHAQDPTYLATVRIKFAETGLPPVTFDVRRDRRDTLSFNMYETEKTSTYLHMGYTRNDGAIMGLRLRWRF